MLVVINSLLWLVVAWPEQAMPREQLKVYLGRVKSDAALQPKTNSAANPETVKAIASQEGFAISAKALKQAQIILLEGELEDFAN